ncbi:MAG: acyl-CoA dehydrogenase [Acidobacteriota bacterium]|nr:acyl-CoA dehydrogenase [Acidobacteriota bacterium]MDQ7087250.1 acyl-CoA dehydrogenase [Acidobacteriota bacterium]
MDFLLNDDQEMMRQAAADFARREIEPHIRQWDDQAEFPREVFRKAGELGFLGVLVPEGYSGAGLGYVEYVTIVEEISKVDPAIGLSVAAHNSLCTGHILQYGSEAQKQKYLPKLATGEWIGAWGLTEPTAGSDAGGTRTTAVRDGDDWVLNGSKTFTTHGGVGEVAVLFAVTDPDKGHDGISAFIVEADNPGYSVGKHEDKLGMRASDTCEVVLQNCRVPADAMIGEAGSGFRAAMGVLDGGRISIAALALGTAAGAYEHALAYAREREQFGRKIGTFQSIGNMLADMATEVDAARLLTYRAASLKDQGRKTTRESAMAKLYASETAVRVANDAIQVFGGYGYVKDYPVEKFYRDAKLCTIGEGTSEIQRLVIARQILGRL